MRGKVIPKASQSGGPVQGLTTPTANVLPVDNARVGPAVRRSSGGAAAMIGELAVSQLWMLVLCCSSLDFTGGVRLAAYFRGSHKGSSKAGSRWMAPSLLRSLSISIPLIQPFSAVVEVPVGDRAKERSAWF
ncbi:NAD(P)H-hydrate epimerase [Striga asiatica]|uniref:NAD(P)H-hydrate epimerase n=1 Tax=Striga asiatica TaxID=4170 RepID=A0A5A7P2C6_STRAF|nr:NAD(P)H-hydrate epimerase [Striga asiatica]